MISNKTRMERRQEAYKKEALIKWSIISAIIFAIGFSSSYALIMRYENDRLIQKILESKSLYELQKDYR